MEHLKISGVSPNLLVETWSATSTRFWLREVDTLIAPPFSWSVIEHLYCSSVHYDADDPSARSEYLSFWTVLRGHLLSKIGPARFRELAQADTIDYFEFSIEQVIEAKGGGALSLDLAFIIHESTLPTIEDEEMLNAWTEMTKALVEAAHWAAGRLLLHRSSYLCAPLAQP